MKEDLLRDFIGIFYKGIHRKNLFGPSIEETLLNPLIEEGVLKISWDIL